MSLSATPANALSGLNVAQQALSVTARVRDCPDGTVASFKGSQRLGSFPPAAPARAKKLAA
jgi:hypothetical protein